MLSLNLNRSMFSHTAPIFNGAGWYKMLENLWSLSREPIIQGLVMARQILSSPLFELIYIRIYIYLILNNIKLFIIYLPLPCRI